MLSAVYFSFNLYEIIVTKILFIHHSSLYIFINPFIGYYYYYLQLALYGKANVIHGRNIVNLLNLPNQIG